VNDQPIEAWSTPRWAVPLFGLGAVLLVPWVALLVLLLPSDHLAQHWDIAWAGFDIALAFMLLAVALAAWRRSPWLEAAGAATATLLFVDAWFDVLTSSTRAELVASLVEAALLELPLAVLCLLVARNAQRRFLRLERVSAKATAPARLRLVQDEQIEDRLSA
jgi:hypothetical protein